MPGPQDELLARLAVDRGMVDPHRLDALLDEIDGRELPLDVALVDRGLLTFAQLEDLHRAGRQAFSDLAHKTMARSWTWRFARRVIERGFVEAGQVHAALREQAARFAREGKWVPLAEILVAQGVLTADQAAEALRLQGPEPPLIVAPPAQAPSAPPPALAPAARTVVRRRRMKAPPPPAGDLARLATLERELAEARASLAGERAHAASAPPPDSDLVASLADARKALADERELGRLRETELEAEQARARELTAELESQRTLAAGRQTDLEAEQSRARELTAELESQRTLAAGRQTDLEAEQSRARELTAELESLRSPAAHGPATPESSFPPESIAPAGAAENSGLRDLLVGVGQSAGTRPESLPFPSVGSALDLVGGFPRARTPASGALPGPDPAPADPPSLPVPDLASPSAAEPDRPLDSDAPTANSASATLDATVAGTSAPADPGPVSPAEAGATPPEGRPFGRYHIRTELGRGGMGVVFRAWDTELLREVALKTLHVDRTGNPNAVARFIREARTAGALDHPGIVPVHDVGVIDGIPYYAMSLVRGKTLRAALLEGDIRTLRDKVVAVHDAADAVAHAHAHRVIHRDLKPTNVLVDDRGRIQVLDFGLARKIDEDSRITATGEMMGTPHYMAPEQIEGDPERMGTPVDVYALGAMLYEALTGSPPFPGSVTLEILHQALTLDAPPPSAKDPRIPLDLDTICLKSLAKDPARRYPDARELAQDLGRWLRGEAIEARRERIWERAARWIRRRKALVALAGAVLLAAGIAIVQQVRAASEQREQQELRRELLDGLRAAVATHLGATLLIRRAGGRMADAEKRFLAPLRAAASRVIVEAPALAEPHYHLGRFYRALLRFDDAAREQDAALAKDPAYAPSLYERLVLRTRGFRERLSALFADWRREESRRLAAAPGVAPRPLPSFDEIARRAPDLAGRKAEIAADLARLEALPATSGLPDARRACIRGLHLLYTSSEPTDRARATGFLEEALRLDSALDEAHEGLINLHEWDGNRPALEAALMRAIATDRGYPPYWKDLARRATTRVEDSPIADAEFESDLAQAEEAFGRILELDPDCADTYVDRSSLRRRAGSQLPSAAARRDELLASAEQDAVEAVRLRADPGTHFALGLARFRRGDLVALRGEDPDGLYRSAEGEFAAASAQDADLDDIWFQRGLLHAAWAEVLAARGEDADPRWRQADECLTRAVQLGGEQPFPWYERADVYLSWAENRLAAGKPADEILARAERDFGKALELAPELALARVGLGRMHGDRAEAAGAAGQPVEPHVRAGIAELDHAIAAAPEYAEAWARRGLLRHALREFVEADADFREAARLDPYIVGEFQSEWDETRAALPK